MPLKFRLNSIKSRYLNDENYFERGLKKIDESIDIVEFVRIRKRLKLIEKVLFNRK